MVGSLLRTARPRGVQPRAPNLCRSLRRADLLPTTTPPGEARLHHIPTRQCRRRCAARSQCLAEQPRGSVAVCGRVSATRGDRAATTTDPSRRRVHFARRIALLFAECSARANVPGQARCLSSCRHRPAHTARVASAWIGKGDHAAELALTIQIVALRASRCGARRGCVALKSNRAINRRWAERSDCPL